VHLGWLKACSVAIISRPKYIILQSETQVMIFQWNSYTIARHNWD